MGVSDYDRKNVGAILRGEGTWFTAQLMRLVAKADAENRGRLAQGFPEEVGLVEGYLGMRYSQPPEPMWFK